LAQKYAFLPVKGFIGPFCGKPMGFSGAFLVKPDKLPIFATLNLTN
jgi:hypothetical protein